MKTCRATIYSEMGSKDLSKPWGRLLKLSHNPGPKDRSVGLFEKRLDFARFTDRPYREQRFSLRDFSILETVSENSTPRSCSRRSLLL